MMERQAPFVTGMTRVRVDRLGRCAGGETEETCVFVWNDLDDLVAHLRQLVQNPESRFELADMLWMVAEARRQMRDEQRQRCRLAVESSNCMGGPIGRQIRAAQPPRPMTSMTSTRSRSSVPLVGTNYWQGNGDPSHHGEMRG
jgi:hypothetical protein